MRQVLKFTIVIGALFLPQAWALSIEATVENKTTKRLQTIDTLELLELKSTMEVIQTARADQGKAIFTNVKTDRSAPLMLRTNYKGIVYSKVLPPNQLEQAHTLDVYENSEVYNEQIKFGKVYSMVYTENHLVIDVFLNFINDSNVTFSEKVEENFGIYLFVPANAKELLASVTVGEGKSDIRWLRIAPIALSAAHKNKNARSQKATHLLPYPLKPGERSYHIQYKVGYNGAKTNLAVSDIYKRKNPVRLIFKPEDLLIEADTPTAAVKKTDEESQIQYIEFAVDKTVASINISGGSEVKLNDDQKSQINQDHQVIYKQSFTLWQRIFYIVASLGIIFLLIVFLRRSQKLFQNYWQRQLSKYNLRLEMMLKSENVPLKKMEKVRARIKTLQQNLKM